MSIGVSPCGALRQVQERLASAELCVGATNLHQDLHFSSFYLRASLAKRTQPLYPGYSFIFAVYEEGVERYYISALEAAQTAGWLIGRSVSEPAWLQTQLGAIERHSDALLSAFPDELTEETLREADLDALIALYHRHSDLHRTLYDHARLPEALDRGEAYFTDYLNNYLRNLGVDEPLLPHLFQRLVAPLTPSVIAEEQSAFEAIGMEAETLAPTALHAHAPAMFLPSSVREELKRHRDQWGWLSYHGFRHRALPTEQDYLKRLTQRLITRDERSNTNADRSDPRVYFDPKGLDQTHRELFRLYAEIGRVKLYRRYRQLRNFYFLDLLLAEFARRLNVSEWDVRCCLPEDLLAALASGRMSPAIAERRTHCAVLYTDGGEIVLTGDALTEALRSLNLPAAANPDGAVRRGTSACVGSARGTARIVGRQAGDDAQFRRGDVLVCEAADPDLLPLIRKASAVVTQQGGVTSHASVLCREIGVPTVIGVAGLLNFVGDGDDLHVDATTGTITRVALAAEPQNLDIREPRDTWERPDVVGNKAANLWRAQQSGFLVPAFTILSWENFRNLLSVDPTKLSLCLGELSKTLRPGTAQQSFLLRSSALEEDAADRSCAGTYTSVSFTSDPIAAAHEFVQRNQKLGYAGSVILQHFLSASACGVSIDGDARAGAAEKLIVEFVPGANNTVTAGGGGLTRMVYDRRTQELLLSTSDDVGTPARGLPTDELVEWLSSLASYFGRPSYVEWGFAEGKYWLYQVRRGAR